MLRAEENKLFETQLNSIASEAVKNVIERSDRMLKLSKSASIMYKYAFPTAQEWPYVAYRGFYEFSDVLTEISALAGQKLGFFPIVRPHQVAKFEKYAAEWLQADPSVPTNAGVHYFGRGIFAVNNTVNSSDTSDRRFHDVSGETLYGSRHKILTPLFQAQGIKLLHRGILFNAHSDPARGRVMDEILDCVDAQADAAAAHGYMNDKSSYPGSKEEEYDEGRSFFRGIGDDDIERSDSTCSTSGNDGAAGVTHPRSQSKTPFDHGIAATPITTPTLSRPAGAPGIPDAIPGIDEQHFPEFVDPLQLEKTLGACSRVTGILDLDHLKSDASRLSDQSQRGSQQHKHPQTAILHPIVPADNPHTVVGFSAIVFTWQTLLNNLIPDYVNGLDVIINTGLTSLEFEITRGIPILRRVEDSLRPTPPLPTSAASAAAAVLHAEYTAYGVHGKLFSLGAPGTLHGEYSISVYPNEEFAKQYYTDTPMRAAWATLAIVLFTAVVFFVYDWVMKREVSAKQAVLDTKRRFVRFISHEVRTPLNTGTRYN